MTTSFPSEGEIESVFFVAERQETQESVIETLLPMTINAALSMKNVMGEYEISAVTELHPWMSNRYPSRQRELISCFMSFCQIMTMYELWQRSGVHRMPWMERVDRQSERYLERIAENPVFTWMMQAKFVNQIDLELSSEAQVQ